MDIRQAILKAADHVERRQTAHRFFASGKPNSEDDEGCPLAWIGFFAGIEDTTTMAKSLYAHSCVATALTGLHWREAQKLIFERLTRLAGTTWPTNSSQLAKALRLYADKFHPADALDPAFIAFRSTLQSTVAA